MDARRARIGVIVCSTRQPRACPQIANFVVQVIQSTAWQRPENLEPTLHIIDLQKWNLPMYDESGIPSQIHNHNQYDREHTRAWSLEVQSYNGFIFVTPQYNWGYPAVIKNAIDYLYNEWKDKPAMVVSYGGHGGGKCNAQLRQVLAGVRMAPTTKNVELTFPDRQNLLSAAKGEDIGLDGAAEHGMWSGAERKAIAVAFAELVELLSANGRSVS